jgi:hypothetical protein
MGMDQLKNIKKQDENQFVKEKFIPAIVYVREDKNFHTRLCIYNYFSELFPKNEDGATVNMWFFDSMGKVLIKKEIHLDFRGQLQFDVSSLNMEFEGTVGVSMIPDTMPNLEIKEIRTGYYVYYFNNFRKGDFSHEWESMKFNPQKSTPWMCVIRPNEFPDTQLIVMNSYYGNDINGSAKWFIRFRNNKGKILEEHKMKSIPPKGSIRMNLLEKFPELKELEKKEGTIGLEAIGNNIQGPFTYVNSSSGDFNLHHFC